MSRAYILYCFKVGIPNLDCGYMLGCQSALYWLGTLYLNSVTSPGLQIFFKFGGPMWPMEQKRWVIFWNDGPKHIKLTIRILYLHTDTDTCMHICILTADYTIKPVLKGHLKSRPINAGHKYCRMLKWEHSAILLTFIKLLFVIKIFVFSYFEWLLKTPLKTCFTVLTTVLWSP